MTTEPNKGDIVDRYDINWTPAGNEREVRADGDHVDAAEAAAEIRTLREQVADQKAALGAALQLIDDLTAQRDSAVRERDAMREALAFYADTKNYSPDGAPLASLSEHAIRDFGARARAALTNCKQGEGAGDEEEERPDPKPIGKCGKCGSPVYAIPGFCGVCKPSML